MPNYPNLIDNDDSLFVAVNNKRTTLTSAINSSVLTIPVVTTSGFPNTGFITILSEPDDITQAEAIRYEGLTLTTFSGTQRGAGSTPSLAHNSSDKVDLTVMAEHHNELKDAVIALENFVGISGSPEFVPKDEFGNVNISGTLSADNLTVTGTSIFDNVDIKGDLTVSGTAKFGQDNTVITVVETIIFASQDTEQTTTSTSFFDANC